VIAVVLLAIAIGGFVGATMDNGSRAPNNADKRSAEKSRSLANGVYAVLGEGLTPGAVEAGRVPHAVLVYDRKYSDADRTERPKYVSLDTSFFVSLVLAGRPDARKDNSGRTLLNLTLAREHVKTLEEFTRAHLDGRAAIVIGGEIITMHTIRSVIKDGKAQITRCGDDACKALLLELAK
jgi:preprotein translocase subunit SecD